MTDHLTSYMKKQAKDAIRKTVAKKKKELPLVDSRVMKSPSVGIRRMTDKEFEVMRFGNSILELFNRLVKAGRVDLKKWPKMPKKTRKRHTSRSIHHD